jgi:DHA1 family tetracycline resistance protein-like MFS transporter
VGDGRRELLVLVLVAFTSLVAFSGFEATFALFGERRLGFGLASAGAVFTAVGLLLAAVNAGLVGRVVDRLGEVATLRLGLASNAVGLLLLAAVRSWWALAPALAVLTIGQGLVTPTMSSVVAGRAGHERRGRALGLQQSAGSLARVVGPATAGVLFGRVGTGSPYVAGAVLVAVAVVLTSGLSPGPAPLATPATSPPAPR